MIAKQRILTDEMVAEIKALFPRYPTKQAVTLPALHIVNDRLRCVPLEAVVEIGELLELAPAVVQDTLSFYGLFKQDKPHGKTRAWVCRSISCACAAARKCWSTCATRPASSRAKLRPMDHSLWNMPNAWAPANTPPACWPAKNCTKI